MKIRMSAFCECEGGGVLLGRGGGIGVLGGVVTLLGRLAVKIFLSSTR